MDQALDNGEFCSYLQPKCNAETGAIVGAEALVRWNHPEYGLGDLPTMVRPAAWNVSRARHLPCRCVRLALPWLRWLAQDGMREGRNLAPVSVNVSMTDIDADRCGRRARRPLRLESVQHTTRACCRWRSAESAVANITCPWSKETIRGPACARHRRADGRFRGRRIPRSTCSRNINVDAIKLDTKFVDLSADNAGERHENRQSV
ncbi:MAG: EAL domain-containing protein [Bifidobacterium pseudocatenulatum]